MTLYNALPRKEYELVFICKTTKEVWHTFIITHQGNSQVKDCKIDLLTQQYEKFSISSEETIDSGFTRFNVIVTSLKSLDQDYSRKNHVYEMILENDGVASKTTKEKFKSLALKAKVTREQVSNDSLEEAAKITLGTKEVKALDKGEVVTIGEKKATSLMSVQSLRRTRLFLEELGVIVKTVTNLKMTQLVSWRLTLKSSLESKKSKILSKVNGLELKVKKLGKPKEVIEPFKKGDALTKEVDSLKCNVSRLQDEALDSSKFKKSNVVLDNMLSRQKLSQGQNMAPEKSAHDTLGDAPARHRRANRPSKIGVLFNDFAKLVDPQTCFANTRDIQTPITRVETTKQGYHLVSRN
ncbi:hypothetical protein Tco_1013296 [Tanacetum coccineum]